MGLRLVSSCLCWPRLITIVNRSIASVLQARWRADVAENFHHAVDACWVSPMNAGWDAFTATPQKVGRGIF